MIVSSSSMSRVTSTNSSAVEGGVEYPDAVTSLLGEDPALIAGAGVRMLSDAHRRSIRSSRMRDFA
ncbi:hypothetical protein BVRB_2g040040 [Beta vulgaris subsp. vulgaris]|nr:hypothetical protein BVRB_2g040040 [Beta vulgaris subsp. vulgaris]